jgi:hypothetical protein
MIIKAHHVYQDPKERGPVLKDITSNGTKKVLNVGGNNKSFSIPSIFDGWVHDLLDIDPLCNPDVLCDARELCRLPPQSYDAVYCSHNLEHYYRHELKKVINGFRSILKRDGFAFIKVPDLYSVMKTALGRGLDLNDVLYISPSGPILVSDVIYGYQVQIENSGQDYYAHKSGFTEKSLASVLVTNGFSTVFVKPGGNPHEVAAIAFLQKPSDEQAKWIQLFNEGAI